MTHVEQLKKEIEVLSDKEFAWLRQWFMEKDWERWDEQLEADVAAGKLDFLIDESMEAKHEGTLQEL